MGLWSYCNDINSALTLLVFPSQVRIINNQSINIQQNKVHEQSGLLILIGCQDLDLPLFIKIGLAMHINTFYSAAGVVQMLTLR